jgi:hypothetical protein
MQIALANGQLDRAAEEAGRILVAEEEPDTSDRRIAVMFFTALLLPLTDEQALNFLRYSITKGSDSVVSVYLPDLLAEYPRLEATVSELITEESAPLIYAALMLVKGDHKSAIKVLETAELSSELERLKSLLLLCSIHINSPDLSIEQSLAYVRDWWSSSWPTVKQLATQIPYPDRVIAVIEFVRLDFWLELLDEEVESSGELARMRQEIYDVASDLAGSHHAFEEHRKRFRKLTNLLHDDTMRKQTV